MTSNKMDSARPDKDGYGTGLHISPVWTKWVHDRSIVGYFKNAKSGLGLTMFTFGFKANSSLVQTMVI